MPLIAVRDGAKCTSSLSPYYPTPLGFPLTALLRPVPDLTPGGSGQTRRHRGVLELYDPLTMTDVAVEGFLVPLESDLTTPLAYFLSNPAMSNFNLATVGLLRPEKLPEPAFLSGPDFH